MNGYRSSSAHTNPITCADTVIHFRAIDYKSKISLIIVADTQVKKSNNFSRSTPMICGWVQMFRGSIWFFPNLLLTSIIQILQLFIAVMVSRIAINIVRRITQIRIITVSTGTILLIPRLAIGTITTHPYSIVVFMIKPTVIYIQ